MEELTDAQKLERLHDDACEVIYHYWWFFWNGVHSGVALRPCPYNIARFKRQ